MKRYREFSTQPDQLLGGVHAVRITVPGYLPLSVGVSPSMTCRSALVS